MKRSLALAAALASAAAACTADTSVPTTPTFSAARYLPERPRTGSGAGTAAARRGPRARAPPRDLRGLTGVKAVSAANRGRPSTPTTPACGARPGTSRTRSRG